MTAGVDIRVFADTNSLAAAAARLFAEIAEEALAQRSLFTAMLSGGSTPRLLYECLATDYSRKVDWHHTHLFFGDERLVPVDHPDSNFRMVKESLISRLQIPDNNVHRIPVELPGNGAAVGYEKELTRFFSTSPLPSFDLIFLGIGEDGHTASLFPGDPLLDEKTHWVGYVSHNLPPAPLVDRVTVTLPLINNARCVVFLASGRSKAAVVQRILSEDSKVDLPARLVYPIDGRLIWMLDELAAGHRG